AFSIHSPLKYESVGVGLTAVNDMIGPIRQTIIAGDVSYTLKFQNKTKLSFGLKAAVNLLGFDRDKLYNSGNPVSALQQMDSKVNPNFGFGILYHGPKFFVGVSTPKILQNSYDGTKINKEQRHYFTTLGLVVDLDKDWKFRPTALLKITEGAPFSLDISASVIYKRVFWIGAMYRIDAAVGAFAQFRLFENFKLGLASEFGTQQLRKYNNGTFEVLMSYELKVFRRVNPNPRFF
ncbi:MAG TPA: type IX secretion system membrane protein PorP/SprF, partial [Taishania sp.]|nr:type IX secretion system membrane protein PorP/SprF [Taishania sp.]